MFNHSMGRAARIIGFSGSLSGQGNARAVEKFVRSDKAQSMSVKDNLSQSPWQPPCVYLALPCCRIIADMTHPDYLEKILTAQVYDVAIETPLDAAPNLSARIGNSVLTKRVVTCSRCFQIMWRLQ